MTDYEIVRVLEICTGDTTGCGGCPLNNPPSDCTILDRAVLDLIKRQQAKIEELSEILSDHIRMEYAKIRAEAIREFAERLKDGFTESQITGRESFCARLICDAIDEFCEEMTER